ncbi:lanthionine synthetase LanC family protein [Cellulomonas sp. SLBN-39]|uniref:lanthionine synthetase LanC family protein n=1 Tax=Cellulomonas sp. SLBN-39 TaxID=2768446 RepID=UPI0011756E26|nr:lanthionine synthetase LanC family protein [Cellulomonas sp. SLBN-39]TQL01980.1 serine/threonine protein kinase [Cellulomonas sp. SLBN-39]
MTATAPGPVLPGQVLLGPLRVDDDAVVVALDTLDDDARRDLGARPGEVAVGHLRSRDGSTVLDADAAAVLADFRTPRTVVDVTLRHAARTGRAAQDVLADVAALAARLVGRGVLVPPGHVGVVPPAPGDVVGPWTVRTAVQATVDGWVARATGARDGLDGPRDAGATSGGADVALKVATTADAARVLDREHALLDALVRAGCPAVAGPPASGEDAGRRWLAVPWVPGRTLDVAAAEARSAGPAAVRALVVAVARTFAALHAAGVVHGDVHPRNVLVHDGRAVLVDLGNARSGDDVPRGRGGVAAYHEPELAAALLAGEEPPPPTVAGEVFALGALLREVVTGRPWVRTGDERRALLAAVADPAPASFKADGAPAWPGLDQVLRRALARAPHDRWPDAATLAQALADAPAPPATRPAPSGPASAGATGRARAGSPAHADAGSPAHALARATRRRYAPDGPAWRGPLGPPRATVAFGSAGVALHWWRLAQHDAARGDAAEAAAGVAHADAWAQRAVAELADPQGVSAPALDLDPARVGPRSTLHAAPGVHLVAGLVAAAAGDVASGDTHLAAALDLWEGSADGPLDGDAALGHPAVLTGLALLVEHRGPAGPADPAAGDVVPAVARARALGDDLAARLADGLQEPAPPGAFLGLAHGRAGQVHAVLRWAQAVRGGVPDPARDELDRLRAAAHPRGPGRLVWPRHAGGDPAQTWPGWCHGGAGHALLWALAHRLSDDPADLAVAAAAASGALAAAGQASATLCCGAAGVGYACLDLHRATGEPRWRTAAQTLADVAATRAHAPGTVPGSLMKGDLGAATLAEDVRSAAPSGFPLLST